MYILVVEIRPVLKGLIRDIRPPSSWCSFVCFVSLCQTSLKVVGTIYVICHLC